MRSFLITEGSISHSCVQSHLVAALHNTSVAYFRYYSPSLNTAVLSVAFRLLGTFHSSWFIFHHPSVVMVSVCPFYLCILTFHLQWFSLAEIRWSKFHIHILLDNNNNQIIFHNYVLKEIITAYSVPSHIHSHWSLKDKMQEANCNMTKINK